MNLKIETIVLEQIHLIKNLWEQLNQLHLKDSTFFKDRYRNFTFEERCKTFSEKGDNEILINIISNNEKIVGYCISTVSKNIGEIDSLFILDEYRKYGYGKKIVEKSISWFEVNNCKKIQVSVAEGHESVFSFYEKFGFYPRLTYLTLRKPNSASNRE